MLDHTLGRVLIPVVALVFTAGLGCDDDTGPIVTDRDAVTDTDESPMDAESDTAVDSGPTDTNSNPEDGGPTDSSDTSNDTVADAASDATPDTAFDTATDTTPDAPPTADTSDTTVKGTPCPSNADTSLVCGPRGTCKRGAAGFNCICEAGWVGVECRMSVGDI